MTNDNRRAFDRGIGPIFSKIAFQFDEHKDELPDNGGLVHPVADGSLAGNDGFPGFRRTRKKIFCKCQFRN